MAGAILSARFRRGATFLFGLEVIEGLVADVASVAANAKPAAPGPSMPAASVAEAFDWTVTARAAQGEVAAGWDLTVPPATTAALTPGIYATTIELTYTSGATERLPAIFFAVDEVTL